MESCGQFYGPRFHAGIYTSHFRPHIYLVWASYKVATKTFHVIWGPLNTFRLVPCFLHKSLTGLYFMTFAAGLLLHPLPISLLMLREKPTVLQSNQLDDIKQVDAEQWQDWTPCAQRLPSSSSSTGVYYSWPWRDTFFTCRKENKGLVQYIHTYFIEGIIGNKRHK